MKSLQLCVVIGLSLCNNSLSSDFPLHFHSQPLLGTFSPSEASTDFLLHSYCERWVEIFCRTPLCGQFKQVRGKKNLK